MDRKESKAADDAEAVQIIRGSEALGYEGAGREEHSGQNPPRPPKDLLDELADNQPEDVKPPAR